MANNTYNHTSDKAEHTSFDPTGTNFPSTATNVQTALALTSPTTQATEAKTGVAKIATSKDIDDGTDDTKIVTPLKLELRMQRPQATETVAGVAKLSTNALALAGTNDNTIVTPLKMQAKITNAFTTVTATETRLGTIKIASTASATAGTDDTTAITPLKLKQALAVISSSIISTNATESAVGVVQLATLGQVTTGTLRDGFAISPYTLMQLKGNNSRYGIVRASTQAQANTGTDETLYISAKGFNTYNGSTTNFGTVKLTNTVGTAGAGLALSATANVISQTSTNGQTINGGLNVNGTLLNNGKAIGGVLVGSVVMWAGANLPSDGTWAHCDGGSMSKTSYPTLFDAIGYTHGGYGDTFKRPDMRGLFVRGVGTGSHILSNRGYDSKGKAMLGNGVDGGWSGLVQTQQVISHKHATGWGDSYDRNGYHYGCTVSKKNLGANEKRDWDNYMAFSNGGEEIEADSVRDGWSTMNPQGLIGSENRPWNMSLYYIIKVA